MSIKRSQPENRSFSFQIIDYDHAKQAYILKNKITGETKTMPKDLVWELLTEQRQKNR
jgi:hypothetical protein